MDWYDLLSLQLVIQTRPPLLSSPSTAQSLLRTPGRHCKCVQRNISSASGTAIDCDCVRALTMLAWVLTAAPTVVPSSHITPRTHEISLAGVRCVRPCARPQTAIYVGGVCVFVDTINTKHRNDILQTARR